MQFPGVLSGGSFGSLYLRFVCFRSLKQTLLGCEGAHVPAWFLFLHPCPPLSLTHMFRPLCWVPPFPAALLQSLHSCFGAKFQVAPDFLSNDLGLL